MAIRITGMASGMDTEAMVQDLVKAYKTKGASYTKTQKRGELKQEAWKSLNKKIKSFNSKYVSNMKMSSYYSQKTTKVSDSTKASVVTSDGAVNGSQTLEVEELATAGYLTGGKLAKGTTADTTLKDLNPEFTGGKITINRGEGKEPLSFDVTEDTKISDVVKHFTDAGYNASFDETSGRLFISAKESGADNDFTLTDEGGALETLRLVDHKDGAEDGAVKLDGQNAKIKLNGAVFESTSNTFSINGLTITAKEKTNGTAISINTDTDYDAVYDKVKAFIKDYSELINEMDKLYNAPANKGYDPLTDDEKEAMSDSEITKWEDKVNESLLRRDGSLSSVSNVLKNAMLQSFDIGGTSYSLSSFGIGTLSYFTAPDNERNAYHIDGDPDDSDTAGNPDKLKAAIAADPETVSLFFQKLATNMSDQLGKLSETSSTRSHGNFYDDKQMKLDLQKYEAQVTKWDDYVKSIEDKYYKQFAKMESAMTKLNSQQNYIAGMFGG
ncbi:MAG: flagellar filament capping protein FliD [Lachnospiraceae bacterium]|nr:flagellar filament capping protein FliD [Lachnospiraceae bacterium]